MAYIITFTATARNYARIVSEIKKLGNWGEVTPSSFVVATKENAGAITERLQLLLGPQESVAIFTVSRPWASYCNLIVEDFFLSEIGEDEDWTCHDWNEETQSRI